MNDESKTVATDNDLWETGELGRDEKYVEAAPEDLRKEIEATLELQMISVRLQKDLLSALKVIADYRGIGYQPLIRDVLGRFARAEIIQIASELQEQKKAREAIECAEKQKQRA